MRPSFATLKANHNSSFEGKAGYLSGADLYAGIGYDITKLMGQNEGYRNTCAVRMSLALIKSGFAVRGRIKIKAGPHAGKSVEPGAKILADQLLTTLGAPPDIEGSSAGAAAIVHPLDCTVRELPVERDPNDLIRLCDRAVTAADFRLAALRARLQ